MRNRKNKINAKDTKIFYMENYPHSLLDTNVKKTWGQRALITNPLFERIVHSFT